MGTQQPSATIVVGLDFEEEGVRALDAALQFASSFPGVDIHVVHVEGGGAKHFNGTVEPAFDRTEALVRDRVKTLAPALNDLKGVRVRTHMRTGSASTQIVQLAADVDADLIVIGTKERNGLERLISGSVAESVVRHARCAVWIVRPKEHENASELPNIEKPCPLCVAKRQETGGQQLWCETHLERHVRPHGWTYTYNSSESRDSTVYRTTPRV
ncbi:universal stress protein [Chondromyces crocatus]|uniref:UspA domain-containing protein n=1 Tax=Chondromyces crocatus TaxID=52 RepID=A0A0K1E5Q1_CHOCO|nr:universal stress protein [Chondromyces crocatus]AKT36201.1 uncharacterized protein CMC5_003150 [Chondromyces crocatus]